MKSLGYFVFIGVIGALCGIRTASAASVTSLDILVKASGQVAYRFNGGTWSTLATASGHWDSMMTLPSGGSLIGNTEGLGLPSMTSTVGSTTYSISSSWLTNAAGSTEAALIYTGVNGTSSTSLVSNLLILDGTLQGVLVYAPPGASESPLADYGYATGTSTFNPGSGTPITELGTVGEARGADTGTGLEGDLEWNGGFLDGGNAQPSGAVNGANIVAGMEQAFVNPDNTDGLGADVFGHIYTSPSTVTGSAKVGSNTTTTTITPTIYFVRCCPVRS